MSISSYPLQNWVEEVSGLLKGFPSQKTLLPWLKKLQWIFESYSLLHCHHNELFPYASSLVLTLNHALKLVPSHSIDSLQIQRVHLAGLLTLRHPYLKIEYGNQECMLPIGCFAACLSPQEATQLLEFSCESPPTIRSVFSLSAEFFQELAKKTLLSDLLKISYCYLTNNYNNAELLIQECFSFQLLPEELLKCLGNGLSRYFPLALCLQLADYGTQQGLLLIELAYAQRSYLELPQAGRLSFLLKLLHFPIMQSYCPLLAWLTHKFFLCLKQNRDCVEKILQETQGFEFSFCFDETYDPESLLVLKDLHPKKIDFKRCRVDQLDFTYLASYSNTTSISFFDTQFLFFSLQHLPVGLVELEIEKNFSSDWMHFKSFAPLSLKNLF